MTTADALFFHPWEDFSLSFYTGLNYLAAATGFAALMFIYLRLRHLFMRPSMLIAGFFHLFLQWPLALYASYFESYLPQPWHLSLAIHATVLLPAALALALPQKGALSLWENLRREPAPGDKALLNWALLGFGGMGAAALGYYLTQVPLTCTGLYAQINAPQAGLILREYSLKLLDDRVAVYAYTFYITFIAPFLFLLLLLKGQQAWNAGKRLAPTIYIAASVMIVITGSLEGALLRYFTFGVVFTLFLLWCNYLRLSLKQTALTAGLVLGLASVCLAIISSNLVVRNMDEKGAALGVADRCAARMKLKETAYEDAWRDTLVGYYVQPEKKPLGREEISRNSTLFLHRIFAMPIIVGGWYFHYAQTYETFGVSGIPRLAKMLGQEWVSTGNVVGRIYATDYYGHELPENVSASTGFLFIQYASFGGWGIAIALGLVFLLDMLMFAMRSIPRIFMPAYMAFVSLACMNLIQTDFSYLLFSGGLLPVTAALVLVGAAQHLFPKNKLLN